MRRRSRQLTPLELRIMEALWEMGSGTVQQVQKRLGQGYAYTTIQTMLTVLLRKGRVRRDDRERAHVYRPAVSRGEVVAQSVKDMVDRLFAGSAAGLMMKLMESSDLTPEEVERIRKRLKEMARDAG